MKEIEELATKGYGVKLRRKKEVWYQRWLAKLLFFNKGYLDNFSNATPNEIHLSDKATWKTICHELQHVVDMRRMFIIFFVLLYYSPQVFALAAFYNPWFLLFLLPLPSVGRMWLEARAYGVTIAVSYWNGDQKYAKDTIGEIEYYANVMSGSNYYWTMPIKAIAFRMIQKSFDHVIQREEKLHQELYEIIKK